MMGALPAHIRDEIETIERTMGVTFTAVCDPEKVAAERERDRLVQLEWFRWHTLGGNRRKLRKDGQPSQRGVRRG